MRLQAFRLGLAALMLCGRLVWPVAAQAQDQTSLANTANSAMQRMSNSLSAALAASSETVAKNNVRAAISAGEQAIAALETLRNSATNDVVRSRSEAALAQTTSAVNKAREALDRSGDSFSGGVQAALAEVNEAIQEFAPVLQLVAPVSAPTTAVAPQALPKTGQGDLTPTTVIGISAIGLSMLAAGALLRRKYLAVG